MSPWEVLGLAVALGCDAFAVGLGVGALCHRPRQVFRLSFHFGLFQFLMPLLGWGVGAALVEVARTWAPWLACGVLLFLGGRMIRESLGPAGESGPRLDPTRGWSLVTLSVATSIDALGVGFSLGIMEARVLWPAAVIGLAAAAMTLGAMKLGRVLSRRFGRRVGVAGGLILIAIGVKLVAG
jgi:putative Mn2+ efflux pump MntP